MAAAFNKQADVIVILLLFAFKHMSAVQLERGMWTRDSDNLTAAHIAIKMSSVECVSVLLYLHPKFAHIVEDLDEYPNFYTTLDSSSLQSKRILKILGKSTEDMLLRSGRLPISCPNGTERPRQLFYKIVTSAATLAMKNIEKIPRELIFLSLRITFFYSVYMFVASFSMATYNCAALLFHILGILSILFMWLLYSKLCRSNPGCLPMNDTAVTSDHQIFEIFRSEGEICGGVENYDFALNLLYMSSNIVKTSSLKVKPVVFYDLHSRRYCCHYCRNFQPLRSRHSKTLGRCIPNYDHYCIFLRNHIGRDNYPYFIGSLVAATGFVLPLFLYNTLSYLIEIDLKTKLADDSSSYVILHNPLIAKVMALIMTLDSSGEYTISIQPEMKSINFFLEHFIDGFFKWCIIWWIIFTILLFFHIYLMALNLTTLQFINISEKGWLNVWKNTKNITKNSSQNIYKKLFLEEVVICDIKNNDNLLLTSCSSGLMIVSKVFHACISIFFQRF